MLRGEATINHRSRRNPHPNKDVRRIITPVVDASENDAVSNLRKCSGDRPCQSILQGVELIVPLLKTVGGTSLRHDVDSEVCHLSCRSDNIALHFEAPCCSVTPLFCSMPAAGMPMADTAKGGICTATAGGPFHLPFPLPSAQRCAQRSGKKEGSLRVSAAS